MKYYEKWGKVRRKFSDRKRLLSLANVEASKAHHRRQHRQQQNHTHVFFASIFSMRSNGSSKLSASPISS